MLLACQHEQSNSHWTKPGDKANEICPRQQSQWNSSSSLSAFHTLISVAKFHSFVCVVFFLRVRCWKRKKVRQKGSHFTVGERGWRRGSNASYWSCKSIKKLQQERHWHRSRAISSRVDSHLCAESLGPHPGRRHRPTAASFLVASFIPRCHVITWRPGDRFQPNSGSDNKNFLGSLEFSTRRTCPNYRIRVSSTICSNLLDCFWTPNIRCRTSLLFNRCFQEKCPIERRHQWSNTWGRCTSSERNSHLSHPYRRVKRTVAYTLPLVVSEISLRRQRWRKFEKAARALVILAEISSAILPFALMQLPK